MSSVQNEIARHVSANSFSGHKNIKTNCPPNKMWLRYKRFSGFSDRTKASKLKRFFAKNRKVAVKATKGSTNNKREFVDSFT